MLTSPVQTNEDIPLVRTLLTLTVGLMGCQTNRKSDQCHAAQQSDCLQSASLESLLLASGNHTI